MKIYKRPQQRSAGIPTLRTTQQTILWKGKKPNVTDPRIARQMAELKTRSQQVCLCGQLEPCEQCPEKIMLNTLLWVQKQLRRPEKQLELDLIAKRVRDVITRIKNPRQ